MVMRMNVEGKMVGKRKPNKRRLDMRLRMI